MSERLLCGMRVTSLHVEALHFPVSGPLRNATRAPTAVFFRPDIVFLSPSGWLGLIIKNPVKSVFFKIKFWQLVNLTA